MDHQCDSAQTSSDVGATLQDGGDGREQAPDTEGLGALRDPETLPLFTSEREIRRTKARQLEYLIEYVNCFCDRGRREREMQREQLRAAGHDVAAARLKRGEPRDHSEDYAAAIMYAAEALETSEYRASRLVRQGTHAQEQLPRVWTDFREGRITDLALGKITDTSEKVETPEVREELDRRAPEYAQGRRPRELDLWLRRFLAVAEPQQNAIRCSMAMKQRTVSVMPSDDDEHMSWLMALLPTPTAHQIKRRLDAVARSQKQPVPHNPMITALPEDIQRRTLHASRVRDAKLGRTDGRGADHRGPDDLHEHHEAGQDAGAGMEKPWGGPMWISAEQALAHSLDVLDQERVAAQQLAVHEAATSAIFAAEADGRGSFRRGIDPDLPQSAEDGDERTLAQRSADMFTAWLLNGQTESGIEIDAHIGITVPMGTLTGHSEHPAISRDHSYAIPAPAVRGLIADSSTRLTWHEMRIQPHSVLPGPNGEYGEPKLLGADQCPSGSSVSSQSAVPGRVPQSDVAGADCREGRGSPQGDVPQSGSSGGEPASLGEQVPDTGSAGGLTGVEFNVLAHHYTGRFPPKRLRQALWFRDGTCQAPGCIVPAENCDIDHVTPWPNGVTTGSNLQVLCRRHHRIKTAGHHLGTPGRVDIRQAASGVEFAA